MKKLFLFSLNILICMTIAAQDKPDVVVIKGEGQITWDEEKMNKKEAQKEAQQLAEIDALQKEFGIVVVKGNSTYVKDRKNGEEHETTSTFNVIGNTYLPGEIIEILDVEFEEIKWKQKVRRGRDIEKTDIKCKLKAKARPISDNKVDFESYTLSGNMKNNKAHAYKEGDSFYLYFSSPVSGYVAVFIDDTKSTVRILPYQLMDRKFENGVPVEADKEYIFFSRAYDYFGDDFAEVDELELAAESEQDLNRVFVIFSTEPFNKPRLKKNIREEILTDREKEQKYTVPSGMPSEDFQRWLINNLSKRENFQRQILDITIEK